ncbi:MAG: DUF2490 domain-containing protein [Legionella longbeachae]|nr:DUF2490 domain-containing protein [Legionella longbeachae]
MRCVLHLFLGLILIFSWPKNAFCSLEQDFQTWLNITAIGKTHSENKFWSRVRYWLEGQQRWGEDSSHFSQTLLRPGLGYALTENTTIWLGYGWVYTGEPFTSNTFEENRIWQQLLWVKTHLHLTLTSRTRMEERFLENAPKTAYRFRQLVKMSIPFKNQPKISFATSDEVFFHLNNFIGANNRGFDQNRLFVGLGYQLNPFIKTEIGYMNQYIRRVDVPNFLSNILSINFYLSL